MTGVHGQAVVLKVELVRLFYVPVNLTIREIRGEWKYLYRAVDSEGNTLDFMLSAKRDGKAAARFFRKVLGAKHTQIPRVITVDKNAAYPVAMDELKQEKTLKAETQLRQSKYLNNMVEQDHRNVKRIVKPMMGFQSFNTARRTLRGIEAMAMIRKGQVKGISQGDSVSQAAFINEIFGVSA
ncbi:IS6 family transposase [Leptolyngbya sp. FACHB-17]|uniref:IS6 family transposase n=1 Tax=unclassified Leptolyngbya TaxID=2650499 RepID=UPI001680F886|nr:IS6 family transposase [Leptolyngbya sp. FACHB-17]MBD2079290.1 IS6 family transposase [Leptolyngbya sp. FACHB-17]